MPLIQAVYKEATDRAGILWLSCYNHRQCINNQ